MLCETCSSDKFRVSDVMRERRYSFDKKTWIYDSKIDSRRLLCRKCGAIIITETKAVGREKFNETAFEIEIKKIG